MQVVKELYHQIEEELLKVPEIAHVDWFYGQVQDQEQNESYPLPAIFVSISTRLEADRRSRGGIATVTLHLADLRKDNICDLLDLQEKILQKAECLSSHYFGNLKLTSTDTLQVDNVLAVLISTFEGTFSRL